MYYMILDLKSNIEDIITRTGEAGLFVGQVLYTDIKFPDLVVDLCLGKILCYS